VIPVAPWNDGVYRLVMDVAAHDHDIDALSRELERVAEKRR